MGPPELTAPGGPIEPFNHGPNLVSSRRRF
jgi:hypothetical protein